MERWRDKNEPRRNRFYFSSSKTSAEYKEDEVDEIMEPEEFSQLPAQHRTQEFNMVRN